MTAFTDGNYDAVTKTIETSDLKNLAECIRERDRLAVNYAHSQWLENGRDLRKAKDLLGHGDFGNWCERELSYSTRTAQKLMRAAEKCGPYIENEPGSHLLSPTEAYLLSRPSVSDEIRAAYIPRILTGEDVTAELRRAIKESRTTIKMAKERDARLRTDPSDGLQVHENLQEAKAHREAQEAEQREAEEKGRANARAAALTWIQAQFGDDLPALMSLAADAGPGSVFSFDTERELLALEKETALSYPLATVNTDRVHSAVMPPCDETFVTGIPRAGSEMHPAESGENSDDPASAIKSFGPVTWKSRTITSQQLSRARVIRNNRDTALPG